MYFQRLFHRILDLYRSTPARVQPRSGRALWLEALEEREVPALLGNNLFPADNPWNEKITNAPVAANSATLVASIGATRSLHPDFGAAQWGGSNNGIPYNVVSGTQAKVKVVLDAYASESDNLAIPIPANALLEGDPASSAQNTSDRHLIVYDRDNNIVYETFNTRRPSETADGQWHADSEAVWDLNKDTFRTAGYTSADAAGLPILPGLVRPDEVFDQGVITHALRFTVPASDNAYVYPASHEAGQANANLPRMGERFRLKASVDISGFSKPDQVILQALKDYGMIVADNGGPWFLSGTPSSRWNDDDLHKLTSLVGGDFEAVNLTPQVAQLSSASGPAGSQVTIKGLDFSGGAGLTQVYFGSHAASFTVVSDTQIITTVPAGLTGTVDVTVHSPYGTSATTSADRFTSTQTSPAVHFQVSAPVGVAAYAPFSFTVTALDAANHPVTGYTGVIHFTSTDAAAKLPADYTFTTADAGVHTFSMTLQTAGSQTVTATAGTFTGSASVTVTKVTQLRMVASASSTVAGTPINVTVSALDAAGKLVTGFTGTIHFSSNDWKAVLPANYTFTAADKGTHTFPVTLKIAGTQPVTTAFAAGGVYGRVSVAVQPAAFAKFAVQIPTKVTLNTPFTVIVKAEDAFGNVVPTFHDSVHFTSSATATLPGNYQFTGTDQGIHAFTVTFRKKGWNTLTVADVLNNTLSGSGGTSVV